MSGNWMNEWEAERIEYDFDLPDHVREARKKQEEDRLKKESELKIPPLPTMEEFVESDSSAKKSNETVHSEQPKQKKSVTDERQLNFEAVLFAKQKTR